MWRGRTMHKSVEKSISRLRGKSIAGPIISFFVAIIVGSLLLELAIAVLIGNMLLVRFQDVVINDKSKVMTIEESRATGLEYKDALTNMKELGYITQGYCVVDENGENLADDGFAPADTDMPVINLGSNYRIKVFNIGFGVESPGADNIETIVIDENSFAKSFAIERQEDPSKILESNAFKYDFWFAYKTKQDNCTLYIKDSLILSVNDCIEFVVPIAVLAIIFLFITIGSFIRSIVDIKNKRSYLKLLLNDKVTGGNNATFFEYFLHRALPKRRNRKRGYAVVDITMSKYQNYCTLYGVDEGERLLRAIYQSIKKELKGGEVVANVGGGNFLLLIHTSKKCLTQELLIQRAKYILENIPNDIAARNTGKVAISGINNIRIKSGLYYLPPVTDEDTKKRRIGTDSNIKNICIKASIAKNDNSEESGLVIYNHEMWEKEIWEQKVENLMHAALENEEFSVYIQPKYSPMTEELMGGEALVRWISPTEGFISPGQFIPIFERTGFVTKLDDYMISHTAKLQADWLSAGKKIVPISVNVSRAHFAQPDLAEHIRDLVDAYPVPHKYIEIELTESAFFDDKKALLDTVHKLQEYGFEVSMDDFGAGYSSLNSLKDLPLNVLKLDADFFRGDDFEGRGEIVVSKAIALAKQLDMRIVAEGVEKKDQVDFLASQECDMIQGFYFAKPMPAAEYESRMGEAK